MIQKLLSEFLGSLFLLIVINGVAILFSTNLGASEGEIVVITGLIITAILFVIMEAFGRISGAHFNPVFTLVMFFEKKITALMSIQYVIVQILGGITGIMLSHLIFYGEVSGILFIYEVNRPNVNYFSEFIGAVMIIYVLLVFTKWKSNKTSFVIALLIGGNILATSSTMFANPQVTIARIFTNSVAGISPQDGLIFVVMQVSGAVVGYLLYRIMIKKENEKQI